MSNFKSPITYTFVKCGCSIYFFLKSANLICRSTDISKYFRESLGVRDNESQLYLGGQMVSTSDHKVLGSNSPEGGIYLITVWLFMAQSCP